MRDPTGQVYMRNRYYNPQTGQFTQMDPIGLAGGLNAYGFAAGDPVSYRDPMGLCPAHMVNSEAGDPERVCPGDLTHSEYSMQEDGFAGPGQQITPLDRSIASQCRGIPRCRQTIWWATPAQRRTVLATIDGLSSTGFCAIVKASAQTMVARGLAVYGYGVFLPDRGKLLPMYGETPYAYEPYPGAPGPLMFLRRDQLTVGETIGHEGIHGMQNGKRGYAHGDITPMGVTMERTAEICSGQ